MASSKKCFICGKELSHLSDIRQTMHINTCLDKEETSSLHEKETAKWQSTYDCPLCGEALGPGPYRAAHAKKCGQKNKIPSSKLLDLMDTQSRLADNRKKNGLSHTKAKVPELKPKKPKLDRDLPCSALDEQLQVAKALSMSELDLSADSDQLIGLPKSKSGTKRKAELSSELPANCQCQVMHVLHERFLQVFHPAPVVHRDAQNSVEQEERIAALQRALDAKDDDLKKAKEENERLVAVSDVLQLRLEVLEKAVADNANTLEAGISTDSVQRVRSSSPQPMAAGAVDSFYYDIDIVEPLPPPMELEPLSTAKKVSRYTDVEVIDPPPPRAEQCEPLTSKSPAKKVRSPTKRGAAAAPASRWQSRQDSALGTVPGAADIRIVKEVSVTPFPNFALLSESELNDELNKYGIRPMGRKKAIQMLQRIYERTHPPADSTPIVRRLRREGLAERLTQEALCADEPTTSTEPRFTLPQLTPPKRARGKAKETAVPAASTSSSEEQVTGTQCSPAKKATGRARNQVTPEALRKSFLEWLRKPENEELYNELLTLNPVILDRLVDTFGAEHLPTKASVTNVFTDVLDELHVTFCMRQDGWNRRRRKH